MKTLYDIIYFEDELYNDLTNDEDKRKVDELVSKLKPLESEIIQHLDGDITIKKNGDTYTLGFPSNLSSKITKIITEN